MIISLLHATRRPKEGKECQKRWLDLADNRSRIEIITAVDADDTASREAFPDAIVVHGSQGCCPAYNAAAEKSTGDILFQLDDDNFPPAGWDSILENYMCNGADILHLGDRHRKDDLICHTIISRRYYETMGFFHHGLFRSVYSDNYHTTLAKNWGYVDASKGGTVDLGWEHRNPSRGFGEEDEIARISNSKERYAHGAAVYERLLTNNVVLAFTAYNRPEYLKESLESWLKNDLSLVTSVQFFIEPSDKLPEIIKVIDDFAAQSVAPVIKHVNPEKYGVLRNPWELFRNLFEYQLATFVILGEDDFIVSPDTLAFFEKTRHQMQPKTLAICAKNVGEGSNYDPSTFTYDAGFSGNVWGLYADKWKSFLRDSWDFDYSSGDADGTNAGFDWNIALRVMPKNGLKCLVPTASRSYHIGLSGVHCTAEDYANTTTYNFVRDAYNGPYTLAESQYIREASCSSAGDLGDNVVSLATVQHSRYKMHYFLRDTGGTAGIVSRAHIIKPLLEAQPYIASVQIWKDEPIEWASEGFRGGWVDRINCLAGCHAKHALDTGFITSLPNFSRPWLVASPNKEYADKIIINRSARYQNSHFPWAKVVQHYGDRLVFFGTPAEHKAFVECFGGVEYRHTKDLLEVAQAIAGCQLFIGNQSSCMAIAEGLKHRRILEGSLHIPDCVYPGALNAQYVFDGSVIFPDIGGSGILKCESQSFRWQDFDLNMVPQVGPNAWGWFYKYGDEMLNSSVVNAVVRKLKKLSGWDEDKCREEIVKFTVNLNPKAFAGRVNRSQFDAAKLAVEAAGIKDHPLFQMNTSGKFV